MSEIKLADILSPKYQNVEKVADGSVVTVYRAFDQVMERDVAIKVLDPKHKKDFLLESRRAGKVMELRHRNIEMPHNAAVDNEVCYLVTEYIDGPDLETYVTTHGPLSLQDSISCIGQAARGLAAAHAMQISHGSVDASHIMRAHDGTTKVVGFATALFDDNELWREYLAKSKTSSKYENSRSATQYSGLQKDIICLGLTWAYLVTGAPTSEFAELPPSISNVVARMTAPNADTPLASMESVVSEIEAIHSGPQIFISYRRDDAIDATHRLYEHLTREFGGELVFMDLDSIPLGEDFRQYLEAQVNRCKVFLAVIGNYWLNAMNEQNQRRIDDPNDFVRIEIATAVRLGKQIIPVLVGRASIPPGDELPAELQPLVFRQAAVVQSGPEYHVHVDRLISRIKEILAKGRDV